MVMSAVKLKGVSAAQVADYFLDLEYQSKRGDYYAGHDGEPVESPGVGQGAEAALLGLTGPVTKEQLLHLLDGRHPITGERLVGFRKDRVSGHDLTLSAPKEVSAAWAAGSAAVQAEIQACQDGAVAETVG